MRASFGTKDNLGRLAKLATTDRHPLEGYPENYHADSPSPEDPAARPGVTLGSRPSSSSLTESDSKLGKLQQEISELTGRVSRLRSQAHSTELPEKNTAELDSARVQTAYAKLAAEMAARERHRKRADGRYRSSFADVTAVPVAATIFDAPYFKNSDFYGFYILFWIAVGFSILRNLCHTWLNQSLSFYNAPVLSIFLSGLPKIAVTDLVMYLSTYGTFFIQYACRHGWISWQLSGWIIQSLYEVVFSLFWIYFVAAHVVRDQWIGRVFLVLHLLVLLMKIHSYAFYNGYLWGILTELQLSETYLKRLGSESLAIPEGYSVDNMRELLLNSIAFCKYELLHQSHHITKAQDKDVTEKLSAELCESLIKFPKNISLKNYFEYTMYPTVVYELVYIRTKNIRWFYLAEKVCAVIGVVSVMLIVAELGINPLVVKCNAARGVNLSAGERFKLYCLVLIDMIPPFATEYLLVFYLIWDTILNGIAELSYYADRDFYGPWWSCTDWSEFARIWNKPVHRFLLRHVYHSSISALSLTKLQATLMTFWISAIVHELVMYLIFNRVRGYLLIFQMAQIPLVIISRTLFMRHRKILGNVICWFGFVAGPPIICTLYLVY